MRCKQTHQNEPVIDTKPISGNAERPSWAVSEDYDMTSSMTAVVKVTNLNGQMVNDSIVYEDDLLAAFNGETCVGIAKLVDGLFYLYITAPKEQMVNEQIKQIINLKYYSATLKNIFISASPFPFINDSQLGTVSNPFTPEFVSE